MDIDSSGASYWLSDYGFDISIAEPDDYFIPSDSPAFTWLPNDTQTQTHPINPPSNISFEMEYSLESSVLENGSSKRLRTSETYASGSKAGREKVRREKLNDRFLELSSVLEPDRLPKTDKVAILSDAVRVVTNLRSEADKLKEMNDELRRKVKELKAEKSEIRAEKNKLKLEKEKLEQKVKLTSVHSSFHPHTHTLAPRGQATGHKLMPFIGYPGMAMWQYMSPATVDTSRDHLLRPPVA